MPHRARTARITARGLRSTLARVAAMVTASSTAIASAGCCAWPFEEPSSGYSTSRVVAMPMDLVRTGYRLDEPLPPATCQALCAQEACFPSSVVGRTGTESAVVVCNAYHPRSCTDSGFLSFRMPSGRRDARLGADPALAFAALARAEAASADDFDRLAIDLRAHGAPASLVARTRRARADEVRHDAAMRGLARRGGIEAVRRSRAPRTRPRTLRSLAIDNVVRGCVGETWGALLLELGARRAAEAEARRALASVAEDEARHASLAFAIHRWIEPRLSDADRVAVRAALERAAARLLRARPRVAPTVRHVLGLPTAREHELLAPIVVEMVRAGLVVDA